MNTNLSISYGGNIIDLHSAIQMGEVNQVKTLLELRANPESVDPLGFTPLGSAALGGHVQIIKLLLSHGAHVNARQKMAPLILAAGANQSKAVSVLLKEGAQTIGICDKRIWQPIIAYQATNPTGAARYGIGKNPICREVFAANLLSQSLKFDRPVHFQGGVLDLTMGLVPFFCRKMLNSFQAFINLNPSILDENEVQVVESLLRRGSADMTWPNASQILYDIQQVGAVQIHAGFEGHAIEFVFVDDYLIINNKGAGSRKPGEVYKINRQTITLSMIEKLVELDNLPYKEYENWLQHLPESWGAVSNEFTQFIEGLYPLFPLQTIGNCSWESVETSIFYALAVTRFLKEFDAGTPPNAAAVKSLQNTFIRWLRFTQILGVEKYFKKVDRRQIPFNSQLMALAFQRMRSTRNWPRSMNARINKLEERLVSQLNPLNPQHLKIRKMIGRTR